MATSPRCAALVVSSLCLILLTGCGGAGTASPAPSSVIAASTPSSSSSNSPAPTTSPTTSTGTTSAPITPTTTAASSLPAVPAGATVFTEVQSTTDSWSDCSTCAGGTSTSNYWTAAFQTTPSLSGASRVFYNGGGAWANALWIKKFGNQDQASHFLWDFWASFDAGAADHLWTAEYDLWQSVGGQEFMIGSQCNFGNGVWDIWNSATGHWVPTSVPCKRFAAGTWHHIQWYVERISANQYRYDTLVVDDVPYTINQVFTTNPIGWADSFGVQWQLDLDGSGVAAQEWVDHVQVSLW